MKSNNLTTSFIKTLKPKDKPYKISDSARLYLLVSKSGSKTWKWNYRIASKDSTYTLGEFPQVGLAEARRMRDEAKQIVDKGIHPIVYKKISQAKLKNETDSTFYKLAEEWMIHKKSSWSITYASQVERVINRYIRDGSYGLMPIKEITAMELFDLIKTVAVRDILKESERRKSAANLAVMLRGWCNAIFRYAIVSGRAISNPVTALNISDVINKPKVRHNKKLDEIELKRLVNLISNFNGQKSTAIALELLMLTFVRTGELIKAKWSEFNLENHEWIIPSYRMKYKGNADHFVPLSNRSVSLLIELKEISGVSINSKDSWLFTNIRRPETHMSPTTLNRALERIGFNGSNSDIGFTAHGFRGTASTMLHEKGINSEVIERQLAHKEKNSVKAAYNNAQYKEQRILMMNKWSEYLISLKN